MRDIVDEVAYGWTEPEGYGPEITRQAYCDLFDSSNEKARVVMRDLVLRCQWLDQGQYNDPIIEAKQNSLRGVILAIKEQLNKPRFEELGDNNE